MGMTCSMDGRQFTRWRLPERSHREHPLRISEAVASRRFVHRWVGGTSSPGHSRCIGLLSSRISIHGEESMGASIARLGIATAAIFVTLSSAALADPVAIVYRIDIYKQCEFVVNGETCREFH